MAALACDLELDLTSDKCQGDSASWKWFLRYCLARRTATKLQQGDVLPPAFLAEVQEQVRMHTPESESVSYEHENHKVFNQQQDVQLLAWLKRYKCLWHLFFFAKCSLIVMSLYLSSCLSVYLFNKYSVTLFFFPLCYLGLPFQIAR